MRDVLRVIVMVWTILFFALTAYYIYQPFSMLLTPGSLITADLVMLMMRRNITDFGMLWLVVAAPALALFAVWPERSTRPPAAP